MDIQDRQYYKQCLKRLRRKDGKKGKPSKKEILQAEQEMIKFRELIKPKDKEEKNFIPLKKEPVSIAEILRKAQDAGH